MADRKEKQSILSENIAKIVQEKPKLPRRFYEAVDVTATDGGYGVLLDGRDIRTPLKNVLEVPTRALAEAVANEWADQEEFIDPSAMPLTRFSNTALDRVIGREPDIVEEIVSYVRSDLVCYRAEGPDALIERQARAWDDPMGRVENRIAARFALVQGVMYQEQPAGTIDRFANIVAGCNAHMLTALHNLTTLTGSAILAYDTLFLGRDAEVAWSAAHVDEDWQIEFWGEDLEAARRRARRKGDFDAAIGFALLLEAN